MPPPLHVVHLPVYRDNPYQPELLAALSRAGVRVTDGGGGGTFLRTALRRWKPDVVHFHWLHPYLLRSGWWGSLRRGLQLLVEVLVLRATGARVVWTIHNLSNHDRRHPRLERWLTRRFVRLCDRVIAHCPAAERAGREEFADIRPGRWEVIPHPSYVGTYRDQVSGAEARARLGLPSKDLVFLFFGRVQPYKGILNLIAAFRRVDRPGVRLVIAGKPADSEADKLVEQAAGGHPGISYRPGHVPDDEVQVFMRAADVVTLPFQGILTSGSLILAMSFGRVVVAPALGCIPETVAPGSGFLYDPADPNGLFEALTAAAARRGDLDVLGAANRMRADSWSWDAIARRTADLYAAITGQLPLGVSS